MKKNNISFYSSVGEPKFMSSLRHSLLQFGLCSSYRHLIYESEYFLANNFISKIIIRFKMYIVFPAYTCLIIIFSRSSINIITTNPFFNPFIAQFIGKFKKNKVIQLLWDLYPDALLHSGVLKNKNSFLVSLLSKSLVSSLRNCDATVFLGENLKIFIEKKYGPARNGVVIPVGADPAPFLSKPNFDETIKTINFIYSGNLGRMHDVETLAGVVGLFHKQRAFFNIYGHGVGLSVLRRAVDNSVARNIKINKNLSHDDWVKQMKLSHISFITIKEGCENIVMPSKTYSSMVAGHAIIAICTLNSDLASLILEHNCGWVIQPGDTTTLSLVMDRIFNNHSEIKLKRLNSYVAGHKFYGSDVIALKWKSLLDNI
jgi:glycosyltransferase involved in cell wall biosynthesis